MNRSRAIPIVSPRPAQEANALPQPRERPHVPRLQLPVPPPGPRRTSGGNNNVQREDGSSGTERFIPITYSQLFSQQPQQPMDMMFNPFAPPPPFPLPAATAQSQRPVGLGIYPAAVSSQILMQQQAMQQTNEPHSEMAGLGHIQQWQQQQMANPQRPAHGPPRPANMVQQPFGHQPALNSFPSNAGHHQFGHPGMQRSAPAPQGFNPQQQFRHPHQNQQQQQQQQYRDQYPGSGPYQASRNGPEDQDMRDV